jgi:hypothetical protein
MQLKSRHFARFDTLWIGLSSRSGSGAFPRRGRFLIGDFGFAGASIENLQDVYRYECQCRVAHILGVGTKLIALCCTENKRLPWRRSQCPTKTSTICFSRR